MLTQRMCDPQVHSHPSIIPSKQSQNTQGPAPILHTCSKSYQSAQSSSDLIIRLLANHKINLKPLKQTLGDLSIEPFPFLVLPPLKFHVSLFLRDFTSLHPIARLLGEFLMGARAQAFVHAQVLFSLPLHNAQLGGEVLAFLDADAALLFAVDGWWAGSMVRKVGLGVSWLEELT